MRILFCTNSLGAKGGIERVTIVKLNALADIAGNDVAVCFTDKGTYPEKTIEPISPKVKVIDLGVPFWDLSQLDVKAICITWPKKIMALRKALKRVISEFKPDVVVTTGSYEKYALASLKLKDVVKIREYHFSSRHRDFIGHSRFSNVAAWLDNKFLGRFFDKSFLLTQEDLESNFKGSNRHDFMHNPCTLSCISALPWAEREDTVIAVGRLVDVKNFSALIRAWAKCSSKMPGWQLKIAGDGEERAMLESLAKECGVGDSVKFLGFRYDVADLLNKSKIIALTSKCEGFVLNIAEGMSCGCVPVSYAFPYGAKEIIEHGKSGLLVPYMDEQKMAESLLELSKNPALLEQMSQGAIRRAQDFSVDNIINAWMQKYKALMH